MTTNEYKANKKLIQRLSTVKERAMQEMLKEENKKAKPSITFKGETCYTEDDIQEIYEADMCTSTERSNAINKLNALGEDTGDKSVNTYLFLMTDKFIKDLERECDDDDFYKLPFEEQKKRLEKIERM